MTASITTCENCAAELHGEYCHQCGQSVHNPIRHAGHAVEEFFEAFWHLDGRLWRTLRDLMVPGRTANEYLAGHRARYIPPLRLFVVLSVLTFFLGALSMSTGEKTTSFQVNGESIADAGSVEEVQRIRDELLADMEQSRADANADGAAGVDPLIAVTQSRIHNAATERIAELGGQVDAGAATGPAGASDKPLMIFGQPWDGREHRFEMSWWPAFANDWLNRKVGHIKANMEIEGDSFIDKAMSSFMASAPTALFVLVPVFALLLKLAYLFNRRLYLEHLVVALYSHAFLLLALAVVFVLSVLGSAVRAHVGWLANGIGLLGSAVFLSMPVYLLLMQKRVYRQGWWLTVAKYLVVGFVYSMLLLVAMLLLLLTGLAQP